MAQLLQWFQADRRRQVLEVMPAVLVVAQVPAVQDRAGLIDRFNAVAKLIEVHGFGQALGANNQRQTDSLLRRHLRGRRLGEIRVILVSPSSNLLSYNNFPEQRK